MDITSRPIGYVGERDQFTFISERLVNMNSQHIFFLPVEMLHDCTYIIGTYIFYDLLMLCKPKRKGKYEYFV